MFSYKQKDFMRNKGEKTGKNTGCASSAVLLFRVAKTH